MAKGIIFHGFWLPFRKFDRPILMAKRGKELGLAQFRF
jgi:hypothetical protein